jgi:alkylated DNA repair dioxygenase AlkB
MGWHSDGEKIKKNGAIASVSLEQKENLRFSTKQQRNDFASFGAW